MGLTHPLLRAKNPSVKRLARPPDIGLVPLK